MIVKLLYITITDRMAFSDPSNPVSTKSVPGNRILLHRKHKYVKTNTSRYNNNWRCMRQGCNASVVTAVDTDTILREDFLHNHSADPKSNLGPKPSKKRESKRKPKYPSFTEVEEVHQSLNPVDKINKLRLEPKLSVEQDKTPLPTNSQKRTEICNTEKDQQPCRCYTPVDVKTLMSNLNKLGTKLVGDNHQSQALVDSTNKQQKDQQPLVPFDSQNLSRQENQSTPPIQKAHKKPFEYDSITHNILYRPDPQALVEKPDLTTAPGNSLQPELKKDKLIYIIEELNYRPYRPDTAKAHPVVERELPNAQLDMTNPNIPDYVEQTQSETNYPPYQLEFSSPSPADTINFRPYQPEATPESSRQPSVEGDLQVYGAFKPLSQPEQQAQARPAGKEHQPRNPLEMKKKYRPEYPQPQQKLCTDIHCNNITNSPYAPTVFNPHSPFDPKNNSRRDTPQLETNDLAQYDSLSRINPEISPYPPIYSYTPADFTNAPLNLAKPSEATAIEYYRPRTQFNLVNVDDRSEFNYPPPGHIVPSNYGSYLHTPQISTSSVNSMSVGSYRRASDQSSDLNIDHHAQLANIGLPSSTLQGLPFYTRVENHNNQQFRSPSDNTQVQLAITKVPYPQTNIQTVIPNRTETPTSQQQQPLYYFYRDHYYQ